MLTIKVDKREVKEDLNKLRVDGQIPAVFYGKKEESTPIKINAIEFKKLWDEAGESSIISLKEGENDHEVLIHDVQIDPIKGHVLHADFYVIEKGKKLTIDVPIEFEGEAPAEKSLGGVLVKVLYEVEIEALPKDLPKELHVDISTLVDFDSQVLVSDIKVPEGVEIITDHEEVVALVQEPKEEEEEPVEAPDLDSIEVEGEKKDEGESEEGEKSEEESAGE